jgi:osmoprotectant transport system permease protein
MTNKFSDRRPAPSRVVRRLALASTLVLGLLAAPFSEGTITVGSKRFTESYILGEILRQTALTGGQGEVVHQRGLGNTAIVLSALKSGTIDLYPEYTGTIAKEILKLDAVPPLADLNARLAPEGLAVGVPLGFNNTYALAIRGDLARAKGIARLSELAAHPELRLGLSQEFLGRADGWPGLQRAYALPFAAPRGLDHGLAYDAVKDGQVDVIDIYSTDAKIGRYGLVVLEDDKRYFPRYDAVLLYRADLPTRAPAAWAALARLEGTIDDAAMRAMNAEVELGGKDFATVATEFLSRLKARGGVAGATAGAAPPGTAGATPAGTAGGAPAPAGATSPPAAAQGGPTGMSWSTLWEKLFAPDFGRLLGEHLALVFASLALSVAIGIPLGIVAARDRVVEKVVLGTTGVVQTIPALALLAFLIPLTGRIGWVPALIALSLYALLPIVRNTHAGLLQIGKGLVDAGRALSLPPSLFLTRIELPLAAPTIMAGVKTSAVINVGTATIAAFIGAGGFGERIVTGLALNDNATLLAGAIPTAALALVIEWAFGVAERRLVPGLHASGSGSGT